MRRIVLQHVPWSKLQKSSLTKADLDHAHQWLLLIDPKLPPRRGGTLHHLINPDLPLDAEETT
jgi:hypothetical protein